MIFVAFQQVDSSVQREYSGTGLGLSISRQLADLLHGEIQVSSVAGKGSTFTLYLPEQLPAGNSMSVPDQAASTEPATDNDDLTTIGALDDREQLQPDKQTILLLEDDPKFAMVVAGLVHESGFNVLISNDGAEVCRKAKEIQPVGIILDLTLVGSNSQSVLSSLKSDPSTQDIPVHIMSGAGNMQAVKGQGVIGVLQKPASTQQLLSVFERFKVLATHSIQKLLLVEDDEAQCQHLRELLDSHNVEVTLAKTASDAIEQLKSASFNCMVLDLNLKDSDGLQLLKSLNDNVLDELPIIVYTAKDLRRQEKEALNQYSQRLIKKCEKGSGKLLSGVVLFLHRMEANLPVRQRNELQAIDNVDPILNDKAVLLVDDDMRNIYALSTALEDKKMRVIVAKNGREALDQLALHSDVEVVLMDIMMPEMDGYEAMRRIRKQQQYKNLPIISLTAKAMSGDREQCIAAGASDYISKPIEIERLFSIMRVWLY